MPASRASVKGRRIYNLATRAEREMRDEIDATASIVSKPRKSKPRGPIPSSTRLALDYEAVRCPQHQ